MIYQATNSTEKFQLGPNCLMTHVADAYYTPETIPRLYPGILQREEPILGIAFLTETAFKGRDQNIIHGLT
jgi:hypothetical protein